VNNWELLGLGLLKITICGEILETWIEIRKESFRTIVISRWICYLIKADVLGNVFDFIDGRPL
jgi:hypothetical protein